MEEMAICTKCSENKPISAYYPRPTKLGRRRDCIECVLTRNGNYHMKHKTEVAQYQKQYRIDNYESLSEYGKQWNATYERQYDSVRNAQSCRKYQARKASIPDTMPNDWWQVLLSHYGSKCAKCGSRSNLQHDHIIPVTWFGSSHSLGNSQILCGHDNSAKGNRHDTDYRNWSAGIILDDLSVIYAKMYL